MAAGCSTRCAVLLFVLLGAVILSLESQVGRVQCSSSSDVEFQPDGHRQENGVEESSVKTKSWKTLNSTSQGQMLRLLRARQRGQNHSVGTDDLLDHSTGAKKEAEVLYKERRMNLEKVELDKMTQLPVQQLKDLVTILPGQPPVEFAQYAGYITVDEVAGRALFYYFVQATSSPETKPLLLWLNGGPGCSSLAYGAFEELGPFRVNSDGATLSRNHYAWNKLANIIFLESPAGVGFSYSNTSSDYESNGDERTASDSLTFLVNWFQRFPQYNFRDFYITGESYAGNYVPQLAQKLVYYNKGLEKPFINLKGVMVGNGILDDFEDNRGTIDYWWTHALISDETHALLSFQPCNVITGDNCDPLTDIADKEMGNIDPYDIYTPACLNFLTKAKKGPAKFGRFKGYDPCQDNYLFAYFNSQAVLEALHVKVSKVLFPWQSCSDVVGVNWKDSAPTVIPIYKELIPLGLKIWIFSGDVDSVVPVTATRYSLALLQLKTTVPWYAWYRSGQVGGYTQGYEGLTFVTVRNAGHEVPLYQPARALTLISSYLSGEPLPPQ